MANKSTINLQIRITYTLKCFHYWKSKVLTTMILHLTHGVHNSVYIVTTFTNDDCFGYYFQLNFLKLQKSIFTTILT